MGTPSTDDTNKENNFEQQVNDVVSKMTVDEKGHFQLPDGVEAPDEVIYAAKLEKRYRDTQGSYTKSQQELKRLQAENEKLASSWEQDVVKTLSSKDQARLEELKTQDPDSWREEITKLEETKRTEFKDKRTKISEEASQMTELELREQQLREFNEANPTFVINDDVIENDIPPRITRKLEKGEISFADFLDECKTYLDTPKKIDTGKPVDDDSKFAKSGGSKKPSDDAISQQSSTDYSKEIF